MNKGYFFTFEGIDKCGKTTQIKLLSEYLTSKNITHLVTREPGGADVSEKIRELLLSNDHQICYPTELLLMLAARVQHIEEIIKPVLKKNVIVLCDRFSDSTIAYQGYGNMFSIKTIRKLHDMFCSDCVPDKTFIFDISVDDHRKRLTGEKDRIEKNGIKFYERVREGFRNISPLEPNRIKLIDGTQSKAAIFKQVKKEVMKVVRL